MRTEAMKKSTRYILLIIMLVLSLVVASGCGAELGASMYSPDQAEDSIAEETEEELLLAEEETGNETSADIAETDEDQAPEEDVITVVLNTNKDRKRIHMRGTSCADQIHEENYQEWTGTAEELIEFAGKNGYVACGRCHPDEKLGIELPKNK